MAPMARAIADGAGPGPGQNQPQPPPPRDEAPLVDLADDNDDDEPNFIGDDREADFWQNWEANNWDENL